MRRFTAPRSSQPQDLVGASEWYNSRAKAHVISQEFAARVMSAGLFSGIARPGGGRFGASVFDVNEIRVLPSPSEPRRLNFPSAGKPVDFDVSAAGPAVAILVHDAAGAYRVVFWDINAPEKHLEWPAPVMDPSSKSIRGVPEQSDPPQSSRKRYRIQKHFFSYDRPCN